MDYLRKLFSKPFSPTSMTRTTMTRESSWTMTSTDEGATRIESEERLTKDGQMQTRSDILGNSPFYDYFAEESTWDNPQHEHNDQNPRRHESGPYTQIQGERITGRNNPQHEYNDQNPRRHESGPYTWIQGERITGRNNPKHEYNDQNPRRHEPGPNTSIQDREITKQIDPQHENDEQNSRRHEPGPNTLISAQGTGGRKSVKTAEMKRATRYTTPKSGTAKAMMKLDIEADKKTMEILQAIQQDAEMSVKPDQK